MDAALRLQNDDGGDGAPVAHGLVTQRDGHARRQRRQGRNARDGGAGVRRARQRYPCLFAVNAGLPCKKRAFTRTLREHGGVSSTN